MLARDPLAQGLSERGLLAPDLSAQGLERGLSAQGLLALGPLVLDLWVEYLLGQSLWSYYLLNQADYLLQKDTEKQGLES